MVLPSSRQAALRTPEPTATPGHSPVHQRAPDPAPQISDPGPPRLCSQRSWDPVLPTSVPTSASGPPQPQSLPWQDPAHAPSGWHQLSDLLSPSPTLQQANTSSETFGTLSQLPQDQVPPTTRLTQALGQTQLFIQLSQVLALPRSRPTPAPGPPRDLKPEILGPIFPLQ